MRMRTRYADKTEADEESRAEYENVPLSSLQGIYDTDWIRVVY